MVQSLSTRGFFLGIEADEGPMEHVILLGTQRRTPSASVGILTVLCLSPVFGPEGIRSPLNFG